MSRIIAYSFISQTATSGTLQSLSRGDQRRRHRIPESIKYQLPSKWLLLSIVCLIGAGAFYTHQVVGGIKESYLLKALDQQLQELERTHEQLKIQEGLAHSLSVLRERSKPLGFVDVGKVRYLAVPGEEVARHLEESSAPWVTP